MLRTVTQSRLRHPILAAAAAAAAIGLSCAVAGAQTRPPQGLNALDDERVMAELANRGLDNLLTRLFDVNEVPQDKRDGILTLISLRRLSDPSSTLTARQREDLIRNVVRGIEQALPRINDPRLLLQQSSVLIQYGIQNDVATLEYWGTNPRVQAQLAPIADAVIRILDRAIEVATAQRDDVANQIRSPDDRFAARYMELENFIYSARYTRAMAQYYRVLAMDRADSQRSTIVDETIQELSEHDNPESEIQPVIKLRIAKMLIARGGEGDYDAAKQVLQAVAQGQTTPVADIAQQYEAMYFTALADLLAGKLDDATQALERLRSWQDTNLPKEEAWERFSTANAAMLEYRITAARAEAATGDAAQKLNDEAVNILVGLVREQPQTRAIVYEQLLDRLPENPDVTKLDPLLLRALMRQGELETRKPDDEPRDMKVIERAAAATEEFLKREAQAASNVEERAAALLLKGLLLEELDRPIQAADAFVSFVAAFKGHENAGYALDSAMALIGGRLGERHNNPRIDELYTRVLELAVAEPFNRVDLAYQYGRQLQQHGRYLEAARAFEKVPADAPNALFARYFRMISLKAHLDTTRASMPKPEQDQILQQIQELAQVVRQNAAAAAQAADNDQERQRLSLLLVQTTLMSADLANRVQGNPQEALRILEGFERQVAGLPREQQLLGDALFVRVDAYMELGRNAEATNALVSLLNTRGGSEGAQIIYDLLQRLNQDFEQARRDGDREEMRTLASARAQLTGHLVTWAAENADPNIRAYTYRYRVFDADSQRQAAALLDDPAERRKMLEVARERYQQLLTPQAVEEYRRTIEGTDADPNQPDPVVSLGLAQVAYDLGDYRTAQPLFTRLIADRRLGPPRIVRGDELVDNDQYWEAMFKLFHSNIELASSDPKFANLREETKQRLAQLYIMQGNSVGGQRWGPEFEKLRKELLPDFTPPAAGSGS